MYNIQRCITNCYQNCTWFSGAVNKHTCGVELSSTVLLHATKLATFLLKCNVQAFYNTHTHKPVKDFKASEDILSAKVHQSTTVTLVSFTHATFNHFQSTIPNR